MYQAIIFDFFGVVHNGQGIDTGVIGLVKELHGRYKIGLLSNSNRGYVRPLLEKEGIADLFDAVIVSGEVGVSKPDPGIFRHVLEQMKIQSEATIFIDDSPWNVDAAEAVGIRSIIFTGESALRGELKKLNII